MAKRVQRQRTGGQFPRFGMARTLEALEQRSMLNVAPVAVNDQYTVLAGEALRNGVDLPVGLDAVAQSADGHVYGLVIRTINWRVARDEAAAMTYKGKTGHLVTFSSAAEQQFVLDQLVASYPASKVNDIWIGFEDFANEGQFRWVTGEPVTFTGWAPGEPNNAGDEDVTELYRDGKWNDITWGDGSTAYVVEFDGPFQTGVLANDTDADHDLLTANLVSNAAHGDLTLNADGSFVYVADLGFSGVDTFTYRASDGPAQSAVKTVTINVTPNSAPVAVNDAFEVMQFSSLSVGHRLPEGVTPVVWSTNGHAYMQVNDPVNWEQAVARAATWEYHGVAGHLISITSSAENDFMLTRVMRRISDEQYYIGLSDIENEGQFEWVTGEPLSFSAWGPGEPNNSSGIEDAVELYPYYGNIWNDVPPSDVNSGYFVEFEPPFHGGVLKNDVDAEGRRLTAELVDDVDHGTLTLAEDGTFVYTPDVEFVGTDSFTYRASDGNSTSNTATATITVLRFNTAPTPVDDFYYAPANAQRDVPANQGVLKNDADAESDPFVAELVTGPSHGQLVLSDDGSFTYTPAANFVGFDSFTYRAADYGLESATAKVTIQVATPVAQPIARDDIYSLGEDQPLSVGGQVDVRAGLMHEWKFDESSGNVATDSVSGNAATLFNWTAGQDKWTHGKIGGALGFNSAIHYARTTSGIVYDQYTIAFWLRVDAITGVNPRIATPAGGAWVAIASEYQRGVTTYASDPQPPQTGVWEHYAVAFDFAGKFVRIYRDGDEVAEGPADSPFYDGPWMFGHNQDPNNHLDTLNGALDELRIYNRLLSPSEVATISQAPSPLANDTAAFAPATEMGALFEATSEPLHGELTWTSDGQFVYSPDDGHTGVDSFQYRFVYNGATSNLATVTLYTDPVNDPPVAALDRYTFTNRAQPLVVSAAAGVLANDQDIDSPALTAVKFSNPQRGSVNLSADGGFQYTPGRTFVDRDAFQYRAYDGVSYSEPVTVEIVYDIPRITVGAHTLLANTPNQTIQILVTGGQAVSGLNLYAQVGDGGPERTQFDLPPGVDGPAITGIDLKSGAIFAAVPDLAQVDLAIPQVASALISIAEPGGTVAAEGVLATITLDTTGLFGGEWNMLLNNVLAGFVGGPFNTDFAGKPLLIDNGTLIIEKATITRREILYSGSTYGEAAAPDKQALLPGQAATFANYSSYVGGINALAVEIADALGTPASSDFAFYVGNSNDTSTWQPAPTPTFELQAGAGADGADRIVLRWADGAIKNKWLMVRIKSTVNTGLAADDVFYFGNAIGESGDNPANALVNATDVIGTRDNPHGPFNLAALDDRFDFNRDRLVNATDLVIARDHATSPLTALRLIAPTGTLPVAPPLRRLPRPAERLTGPAADLARQAKLQQEMTVRALDALFGSQEFAINDLAKRRLASKRGNLF